MTKSNARRVAEVFTAAADRVAGSVTNAAGFAAYWHEAPELEPGTPYATFALRVAGDVVAFEGRSDNYEGVEYYVYARSPGDACDIEDALLRELRRNLVAREGLETGYQSTGYQFARRRVVLTAATRG